MQYLNFVFNKKKKSCFVKSFAISFPKRVFNKKHGKRMDSQIDLIYGYDKILLMDCGRLHLVIIDEYQNR